MKEMKLGEKFEVVVDVITEIVAFFMVLLIAFMYLNYAIDLAIVDSVKALQVLETIKEFGTIIIVGLAGLQFALKRGLVVFIIYAAVIAFIVIMMFFPGVLPFNK